MPHGQRWTEAENDTLAAIRADGKPMRFAAAILGRTYGSTCAQAHKLGLPFHRPCKKGPAPVEPAPLGFWHKVRLANLIIGDGGIIIGLTEEEACKCSPDAVRSASSQARLSQHQPTASSTGGSK